jgi:hypothetical protein
MVSTISLLGRDLKLENVTPASALLVVGGLWVLRRILTVVRILAVSYL